MLIAENITKRFAGVTALDGVCLEFRAGAVTAVIGENGAGKSTLMKILSGVYPDYEGQIRFNGEPVRFSSIRDAQACGIAIIHQELNLIPYLTITENIFLGREITTRWGTLDKNAMRIKTQELLARLKLPIDPETRVSELKVGQQQVVEMAKALLVESDVIIMDEPTSAISESEVAVLFTIIDDLRKENKAIVYISHKLDELFTIADQYVVLRDGKSIESGSMQGIDHDTLIRKMVGRDINTIRRRTTGHAFQSLLSVENLCLKHPVRVQENQLKNISFSVRRGEVVGLFGLMGAGRTELLESLFGLHPKRCSGAVYLDGKSILPKTPADAIRSGMALVPEDRKKDGLVLGMDVQTNISLTVLEKIEHAGLLSQVKETTLAKKYVADLKIKTPSEKQTAKNLSGGNQQKIVLSKWLATNPKLLMLDEPTRGIDVNAKNEIYKLILQLADEGMGILVVSSELPEILAISDRVLVMSEGILTAEIAVSEATEDVILKAAIPKSMSERVKE
ncbi:MULTISPECIES: sugar ABC transporter ATP-binding protein [unclassified Spirosoma]|uniref:sugar ABC transporter ATP-binding protein n=1 Tax=unclassified Spirosoma TaxID=2621999 RepID=UPI000964B97A|nr:MULTISPECIES: sugar ABC transporter ATP-binding protein [unclassified Spirosoma]MBN8822632.1 sugar ABC transporter ATP-binding protein [Spirosoma sp.]OJW74121.1 MAG: D-xylose ABC transporter ATP-binding protein [Spirosoma sp. 48-14]